MTTLNLDDNHSTFQIRGYQPGKLQVNEFILISSAIVTPDQLIENWAPQAAQELSPDSFSVISDLKPDILLIGTGAKHIFLAVDLYGYLINQGIGVEVMDTAAACRTFNALSAENRRVAAALLIR